MNEVEVLRVDGYALQDGRHSADDDESNVMAGEDFAWYQREIPGCFLRVGAREADQQMIPAHSPRFDVAEDAIVVGAAVLAECARRASTAVAGEGT